MSGCHKPRVLVGMSGGVDSSVAAALLVEAGYDVCGAYMKNWILDVPGMRCPWADDLADAKRTAVRLGIDFRVYDFQEAYKREVVDYLISEYQAGRTPNPDIMCNQEVKFGIFLDAALNDGFDYIATGHYARSSEALRTAEPIDAANPPDIPSRSSLSSLRPLDSAIFTDGVTADAAAPSADTLDSRLLRCGQKVAPSHVGSIAPGRSDLADVGGPRNYNGIHDNKAGILSPHKVLLRANDEHKDQTYFLYRMSQRALDRTLFPLGEFTKPQVRTMAKERGLPSAAKADSQGICFVGEAGIREFLSMYVQPRPGATIDVDTGETVGHHDGAINFTIGQRKGLGIGGGTAPYFVVAKDMEQNIVYVSTNPSATQLQSDTLGLARLSWISGTAPKPGTYLVRTRHTGPLLEAHLECVGEAARISFPEACQAVAAGQSVVVYDGERCLGGGIAT